MLLTVLLLGVGVSVVIYNFVTPAKLSIERDKATAAALAQAKEALIGYAASDANRPGSLPCPDLVTNIVNNVPNDGVADLYAGPDCPSYIGRLPWRTLGLPDLRDGSGERLWYAVSREFARNPACGGVPPGSACPHNSDSPGQLTVAGVAGVIAVVFSPGEIVSPAQLRDLANQNTVANYLEGGNESGGVTLTYFTGGAAPFNDKLLPITSDALFNVVNVRVAKEAIAALEAYRATPGNGYYPFANAYGTVAPYSCTAGLSRGRLPLDPAGCGQNAWAAGTIFETNGWFAKNNWNLVTYYAASTACGQFFLTPVLTGLGITTGLLANLCETLGALGGLGAFIIGLLGGDDPVTVTIGGVPTNVKVLVVVTGRAMGAQVHPCPNAGDCMEDAANVDGNAVYVQPSRFPVSNDRMAICVPSGAGVQCPSRML